MFRKFLPLVTRQITRIGRGRRFSVLVRSSSVHVHVQLLNKGFFAMGCSSSKDCGVTTTTDGTPSVAKDSKDNQEQDYVEGVVCQVSDLKENEPKVFPLDEGKVLVIKQKGQINAIGTKCTHYGAPLVSSAIGDGRVRCQWHGACFSIVNGDIEDFPGLDSLPCYQVTINNNDVKVRAKKSELESNKRVKSMAKLNPSDSRHFVVVGGGPAGAECVEALRQEGFTGQISLVCRESYLPYDRVKVSKAMDFDIKKAEFRTDAFYKEHDINILKGISATGVDAGKRTVSLSDGNSLNYDKLFIATGCKPRRLDIPGGDLKNVVVLRDYSDSEHTYSQLAEDKEIVVLGSSFVALEAANYCLNKVKKVTVVLRGEIPFQPFLGPRVGEAFLKLFKEKGVHFITKSGFTKINSDEIGNVTGVELKTGETLKADLVILGIGSTYYTDFVKGSGVEMLPDGTIETNEYLQTNDPNVFVGGDIAYSPVWSHNNQKSAIGHYPLAHYHGKIAALNMLEKNVRLEAVPYFWTMLFGKGIRYAGHGAYDDIVYTGSVEEYKYVAFYIKDGEVVATSSCGMDPVVSQFAEHLAQGKKLLKEHLQEDPLSWTKK